MTTTHRAIIVVDLGFGDAGKGTVVDFLARHHAAHTVVRFNGGGQAAHNVVTPDGRHHTFAQFGSGSFCAGVGTYLSPFMLVDPLALLAEERHLRAVGVTDALASLAIDQAALIVTPLQQAMNRLRELARGAGRHGSCGLGIGETMADALAHGTRVLHAGDLGHPATVRHKVAFLRDLKLAAISHLRSSLPTSDMAQRDLALLEDASVADMCADLYAAFARRVAIVDQTYLRRRLAQPGTVIFEGAQGVLLDEWYGFHPYTTWSTTTCANADLLLTEASYDGTVERLGVLRAYATRHGAGPFVTEQSHLSVAIPERHNSTNPWQHAFRIGAFDLVASRYALAVAGQIDGLAITNLDRLNGQSAWPVCHAYHYTGPVDDLPSFFVHTGPQIQAILALRPPDLDRQAALTQRLLRCQPLLEPFYAGGDPARLVADRAAYCAMLGEHLGVPISLTSSGPTAADKMLLVAALDRCRATHQKSG